MQAYVIQMQLVDALGQAFTPSASIGIDFVTDAVNPPANITAPTNSYLVESRPVQTPDGLFWKASARSTINPAADEPLKAYAILVEACPQQGQRLRRLGDDDRVHLGIRQQHETLRLE